MSINSAANGCKSINGSKVCWDVSCVLFQGKPMSCLCTCHSDKGKAAKGTGLSESGAIQLCLSNLSKK